MNAEKNGIAFGAPGIEPRWTRSTKEGIGTAYHTSCRVWFTLSHGIINELYYPNVDCPNTRDLQFLITDGETFCHEERRDLDSKLEFPEKGTLYYVIVNSDPQGRYRLRKDVITDPHTSVFLMRTHVEIMDEQLRNKLRLYALLSPHMKGLGQHNSARWFDVDGKPLFHAHRQELHMVFGASPDFKRRSVGYVGFSDGFQDLSANFKMNWEFERVEDGNIALTGEVDGSRGWEFVLGVAFGRSPQSASSKLLQSLARPFEEHLSAYVKQWKRTLPRPTASGETEISPTCWLAEHTGDEGRIYRLSRLLLLAHEDKIYPGALVASMSIPWGEEKGDADLGGYHLVWSRDLVQSASALLASGQTATPLRSLIWLACVQDSHGGMPQNSWIDGSAYWHGRQLDEVAAPILLAWRLKRADALGLFDPTTLVSRATRYLILEGPVTGQERWEENSGYSPATLAWIIAALVCSAELAASRQDKVAAAFILDYADWLSAHLEDFTVTTRGELVAGHPRHFIRITPADPAQPTQIAEPDEAMIDVANAGGRFPARNIVSGDFLELVRLGVRDALDPLIVESVAVIDQVLKRELPQGPCWRRYNHDGYGQKDDGGAFDGTGTGRCWPLLTGERGHYELAAGRDPLPYIHAMERFANEGGMFPEQVWDADDLPGARMWRGGPTGAAMPLCWAHAEYINLVRSHQDGVGFDLIPPVKARYGSNKKTYDKEIWTFAHQILRIPKGKFLRIITGAPVMVHWSIDEWKTARDQETTDSEIGCWFADLDTKAAPSGTRILFTFRWPERWEGRDFVVMVD
jgi:glucoamylase